MHIAHDANNFVGLKSVHRLSWNDDRVRVLINNQVVWNQIYKLVQKYQIKIRVGFPLYNKEVNGVVHNWYCNFIQIVVLH